LKQTGDAFVGVEVGTGVNDTVLVGAIGVGETLGVLEGITAVRVAVGVPVAVFVFVGVGGMTTGRKNELIYSSIHV